MSYKKRWQPSKTAKREFAIKMQDPEFANTYNDRKAKKLEKKRDGSKFDYEKAGGEYVPTKMQHDFIINNPEKFETEEQINASKMVLYGYSCNEKIHHDFIHIVNEVIRTKNS